MRPLILITLVMALHADEVPALASRIERVTVYLDRAVVTRSASAKVAAGVSELRFAGLPGELDESSLRLELRGPARLVSLQTATTVLEQHPEAEIRALQARIEGLEADLARRRDDLALLERARKSLGQVEESHLRLLSASTQTPRPAPTPAEHAAFLDFIAERAGQQAARERELKEAIARLERDLAVPRAELSTKQGRSRLEQKTVMATVNASAAGEVTLALSYLLPGALWFPTYDLRADLDRKQVEVASAAMVQNATGEDWTDVALTLSASRPTVAVDPPEPAPWRLGAVVIPPYINAAPPVQSSYGWNYRGRGGKAAKWNDAESQSADPFFALNAQMEQRSAPNRERHQNLLANAAKVSLISQQVEKRGTSVVFAAPGRSTVPQDGKPHRVGLAVATLAMEPRRYAVPKASSNTFLVGRVVNTGDLPLLPGDANVMIGADLIGTCRMDFTARGETAEIYLGVDERIKVARVLDKGKSASVSSGKRARLDLAYVITVESFHAQPVEVTIHEALPVSQDEEIRVRLRDPTPKAETDARGVVNWKLNLEPNKPAVLGVGYTLEFPTATAAAAMPAPVMEEMRQLDAAK